MIKNNNNTEQFYNIHLSQPSSAISVLNMITRILTKTYGYRKYESKRFEKKVHAIPKTKENLGPILIAKETWKKVYLENRVTGRYSLITWDQSIYSKNL